MLSTSSDPFAFSADEGEMSRLIRAHDWRATSLGDPADWPEVLHTLVGVMVASSQPMFIVWGPARVTLYNDSYAEVLAGKHPALGLPFEEIWPEIWESDLEPIVARAYAGEALHMDDITLMMMRKGYLEETHFSFSYTPVRAHDGAVAGFFCPCLEITEQVLEEHRAHLRAELTDRMRALTNPGDLAHEAARLVGRHLGAGQAAYVEVDEDGVVAAIARDWTDGEMPSQKGEHRLDAFGSSVVDALRAGRIIAVDDVETDERTRASGSRSAFQDRGMQSFIFIPLMRRERLAAIFAVSAAATRRWRDGDVALATEAAERVFAAVEQSRAETERRASERRLRAARDELALATSASNLGWGSWDFVTRTVSLDARGRTMMDFDGGAISIADWLERTHVDDRAGLKAEVRACLMEDRPFDMEFRIVRKDGAERILHGTGVFEGDGEGEPAHGTGFIRDVTDRKRAEQHQTMLMAELDHRVKNILAVIQSIARQTLGRDSDPSRRFVGRINALAQSHTLLAERRWEGAGFMRLVETTLAAHGGGAEGRVSLDGPDLTLNPRAAQTLTLALHELVTNAAKHGALSGDGRVTAHWAIKGEGEAAHLVFCWREQDGPPISVEPERKGFGSFLIEQTLKFELGGEVRLDFNRDGFVAEIDLPMSRLRADTRL